MACTALTDYVIYPDAATAATLGAPANSPIPDASFTKGVPIAPLSGPDGAFTSVTFVRISMSNPASATPPQVTLTAMNPTFATVGTPRVITATSAGAQALDDGHNPSDAAYPFFDVSSYANNVYLLKIVIEIPGTTFLIQINQAGRDFVWVAASSDACSQQPWMHVAPNSLTYSVLINQTAADTQQPLVVNNRGTGPLNVTAPSPALTTPYSVVSGAPPFTVLPNPATPPNVAVGYNTASTGSTSLPLVTLGGDPAAVAKSAGHNNQFDLSGSANQFQVALLLDDSGSMAATDTSSASTRLSELQSAANSCLEFIGAFGSNTGTFGVIRFPGDDQDNITTFDVVPSGPITQDMTAAKNAVNTKLKALNNTPMRGAIQRALTASSPAYYDTAPNTDRLMLLMSDGRWNEPAGADPADQKATLVSKNITVYTAGYGQSGQVDYPTLQNLATSPSTTYQVDLGAGHSALDLVDQFKTFVKDTFHIHTAADPRGVLTSSNPEARHAIVVTPYDTKVVFSINWNTPDPHRMVLQLQSPTCDLLTPDSAAGGKIPGVSFSSDQRYQMYVIDRSYLQNTADPAHPRAGTWHMIVSSPELGNGGVILVAGPRAAAEPSEPYSYDAMVESSLRLDVTLDRNQYFAGDPIGVSARLTANGLPLPHSSVKLQVNGPTQSMDNWLAGIPITDAEYAAAARQLAGKDFGAVYIKAFAANLKGINFINPIASGTVAMADPDNVGAYSATVTQTSTPDNYKLYITAVGTTPDGVVFRRERGMEVRVSVRPDPAFTLLNIAYDPVTAGANLFSATVSVTPRDRFGNLLLVDPAGAQQIALQARGGTLSPSLSTSFNGTYTSKMTYAPGSTPSLSLTVLGNPVFTTQPVPPIDQLHWVDQVLNFKEGLEATPGANQHDRPNAVLGDIRTRPAGQFVSLGGYGSITLGINGQVILARADDDITVLVHPDSSLRSYKVEARSATGSGNWVTLGTSPGNTASFSLAAGHLTAASAILITDTSGQTRNADFSASATPGLSIDAVGVKSTAPAFAGQPGCERFFIGYFSDGGIASVANFPDRFVSPIDKYAYKQSEVTYEYYLHSTRVPLAPFTQGQQNPPGLAGAGGGGGNLLYMFWDVDDATGKISLQTSYFVQGKAETPTRDGCVKIYAACQRRPA